MLHELNWTKCHSLKLFLNFLVEQMLGRTEVAAASVVNDNIEMTGFGERALECVVNRARIAQIEPDRMNTWQTFEMNQVARSSPNFVAARDQRLRDRETNSRARAGQKNLLHRVERLKL